MKVLIGMIATVLLAAPALAMGAGVVGEPGYYGRINIGTAPAPQLVFREPIVVNRPQQATQPIYMRVPPGHAKNWKKYCGNYGACGRRVYFVQDGWYNDVYAPHYRKQHGSRGGNDKGTKGSKD